MFIKYVLYTCTEQYKISACTGVFELLNFVYGQVTNGCTCCRSC